MAVDFTLSSAAKVTQDGVTVTFDKAMGSTAPTWYSAGLRLYASNTVTITSTTPMTEITFNWEKQGSKAFNTATASEGSYTHPSAAGEGKWTGSATSVTFTIGTSGQLQLNTFSVTLDGGSTPPVEMTDAEKLQGYLNDLATVKDFVSNFVGQGVGAEDFIEQIDQLILAGNSAISMGDTYIALALQEADSQVQNVINEVLKEGKAGVNAQLDALLNNVSDCDACVDVVNAVKETVAGVTWDDSKSVSDNLAALQEQAAEILDDAQQRIQNALNGDTPVSGEITILPSDFETATSADYSTTKEGVTVEVTASTVNSEQIRIFKGKTITISSESNIVSIEFTCIANGTKQYGPGCFKAQDGYTYEENGKTGTWTGSAKSVTFTAETNQVRATQIVVTLEGGNTPVGPTMNYYVVGSMTNWEAQAAYKLKANPGQEGEYMADFTFAANDEIKVAYSDGTTIDNDNWFPTGTDNNYVITEAGDYTVYFRPAGNSQWPNGYFTAVKKEAPVLTDPTNCAEAREAALSVSANNELYNNGKEYTIEGYVTAIQTAYSSQHNNISFWMADAADGGNVLQAYRADCASADEAPGVGDKVKVTGQLTKYNNTPEFNAGCTFEIIEKNAVPAVNLGAKTIAEFLELKNKKDTCVLTGIVANIAMDKNDATQYNKYGNFDLVEIDNSQVSVYVYGLLTADGVAQKFLEMGIDEGDTLTIKAVYSEYEGTPQAQNAVFVEVKKGDGTTTDDLHPWDEETDFIKTFASYTIDDSDFEEYGSLYVETLDDDMNYIILDITLPTGATGLVPGVYTIDDTYDLKTVHSGIYDEDYGIIPSYAAVLVEEEGELMIDNIWWIVAGTVTIDDELNITVEATNSLGKIVKVYLTAESGDPTAITNTAIDTKAVKTIENGQLIIEKAGLKYNVMGQQIR